MEGRITPREISSWKLANIGHAVSDECEPFADFDDMYESAEPTGSDLLELDEQLKEEARIFLLNRLAI